jgi:DNA repair exonuclease SbcCD nuclease subunit
VVTLNYSLRALEHINQNFEKCYFIPGNHDLYYRDKRDIQSVEWARHLPNIKICNDWLKEGNVIIAPWLVSDDHKKIPKLKAKYMFGHFELPHFMMNAMVAMPDHGELKREDFSGVEHVFSGHFHKRQTYKNITYIGNCFPHNYADASDDERGMMILEWGKEPEFHSWPDQPRYRVYGLGDVLRNTEQLLQPGMHVRVNLDIDISYEEANFIKETFVATHKLRELSLLPVKNQEFLANAQPGSIEFESVDQIITKNITSIESEHFDSKLLLDIYRHL